MDSTKTDLGLSGHGRVHGVIGPGFFGKARINAGMNSTSLGAAPRADVGLDGGSAGITNPRGDPRDDGVNATDLLSDVQINLMSKVNVGLDPTINDQILLTKFRILKVHKWNPKALVHGPHVVGDPQASKLYLEVEEWQMNTTAAAGTAPPAQLNGSIAAMSPWFAQDETSTYFAVELQDSTVILIRGKPNQVLRHLLCVGKTYTFIGLKETKINVTIRNFKKELVVWTNDVGEYVHCMPLSGSNDGTSEDFPMTSLSSSLTLTSYPPIDDVNLYSYQGTITGRPMGRVLELDHGKARIALCQSWISQSFFGLRMGAVVLFRSVGVVFHRDCFWGFQTTARTDVEIVQFARDTNYMLRTTPSKAPDAWDLDCAPLGTYLDVFEYVQGYCSAHSSLEQQRAFITLLFTKCTPPPPTERPHPLVEFLYDWETPRVAPRFGDLVLAKLMHLEQVVCDAVLACPNDSRMFSYPGKANQVLLGRVSTSQNTGQLCFTEGGRLCIECLFEAGCVLPCTEDLIEITEFALVVEHFFEYITALPSVDTISQSLRVAAPIKSKGSCLWHGYLSEDDALGVTRVFLKITSWRQSPVVTNSEASQEDLFMTTEAEIVNFVMPSSHNPVSALGQLSYSFPPEENGGTVFNCVISSTTKVQTGTFPSEIARWMYDLRWREDLECKQLVATCSVSKVMETRTLGPCLFFVLQSCVVVGTRKYDATLENKRAAKKAEVGVKTSRFFSDFALKITARDLLSPSQFNIFVNLENRVLPPGLFEDLNRVWALTNGSLEARANTTSARIYVHATGNSGLWPMYALQDEAFTFPCDLKELRLAKLVDVREDRVKSGACVLMSVTEIFWARVSLVCSKCSSFTACGCGAASETKRLKFEILIEADDATDQCQIFAEDELAARLLNIRMADLIENLNAPLAILRRIDYKINVDCMDDSPLALLRSVIMSSAVRREWIAPSPRRAFVIKDRPLRVDDAGTFSFENNASIDENTKIFDRRFVNVKTIDGDKVKTSVRPRLTVQLLDIERTDDALFETLLYM